MGAPVQGMSLEDAIQGNLPEPEMIVTTKKNKKRLRADFGWKPVELNFDLSQMFEQHGGVMIEEITEEHPAFDQLMIPSKKMKKEKKDTSSKKKKSKECKEDNENIVEE